MTAVAHAGRVYAEALRGEPCTVHGLAPEPHPLPVHSWGGQADAADRVLLAHCVGPTLDVGCGPGRMAQHLARCGVPVLGVDPVPEAVRQARARGVEALRGDVFDPLPREGGWGTVLLADGNVGIGGDPDRLLGRVRALLAARGRVVAEVDVPGAGLRTVSLTLECDGRRSRSFPWAVLGPEALADLARRHGFTMVLTDRVAGRWFTVLTAGG